MTLSINRRGLVGAYGLAIAPFPARAAPSFLEALFAPAARLWPRWQAHDANSSATVDHTTWAGFLRRHTARRSDGVMGLRYRQVPDGDRAELAGYLERMAAVAVSRLNRAEQFAFWANVYNALTVRVVLDRYLVASIRDISLGSGLFDSGPWSAKLITVEGEALSLNDIEHRVLRPIWRDPRVHYAVNCASVGCPDLRPQPFTAAGLDAQLDQAARAYIGHPRGVDLADGGLILSSIFSWFLADFGDDAGLRAHLARYAEAGPRGAIERGDRIVSYRYDWRLNDVS